MDTLKNKNLNTPIKRTFEVIDIEHEDFQDLLAWMNDIQCYRCKCHILSDTSRSEIEFAKQFDLRENVEDIKAIRLCPLHQARWYDKRKKEKEI